MAIACARDAPGPCHSRARAPALRSDPPRVPGRNATPVESLSRPARLWIRRVATRRPRRLRILSTVVAGRLIPSSRCKRAARRAIGRRFGNCAAARASRTGPGDRRRWPRSARWRARARGAAAAGRHRARIDATSRSATHGDGARPDGLGPEPGAFQNRSRVESLTAESWPPMMPASATAARRSAITRSEASSCSALPSSSVRRSPAAARRTRMSPSSRARSKACIGWPSSSMT